MGLYLRKSWTFGPFRVNLSKGGFGVSFGFTGLRVGINKKGVYLHMGSGGIYYRTYLGKSPKEQVSKDES